MIERRLIRIAYFTENGAKLSTKISAGLMNDVVETKPEDISLKEWTRDCFDYKLPIIFIGSVGIAVRTIAPFVANKLTDCPVVVVDELGENAIPILSGHYGGANDIARQIAAIINANAVITTATDINNVFAVDIFAKKNGLFITEKDKIKQVSSKALKGEKLEIKQNEKYIEIEGLKLVPRRIILGIGCKKGKSFEELNEFVKANYSEEELRDSLYGICSIDVKGEELGLLKLASYYGTSFITFSAEELERVVGDFSDSDFVKDTVGVGNVCERAALALAGNNGQLIKHKIARNGMTLAEARRGEQWLEIFT